MNKSAKVVCVAVSAVIFAIVLALNIAVIAFSEVLDMWVVGYKGGSSSSASRAEGLALQEQIQREGTVLVKNEKSESEGEPLLPLDKAEVPKVNVFGWAASDWVVSGSGSGTVLGIASKKEVTDLLAALKEYDIEYNEDLINMYESYRPRREYSENGGNTGGGTLHSFNYQFSRLYEPSVNDPTYYTNAILDGAKDFSNTAIVVLGRVSGESNDSPAVQYKQTAGTGQTKKLDDKLIDNTRTYLEISTEEEELLEYVGATYENVIVLINSTNVMELGFMDTIEGLDACLIVGPTGTAGANAIPKIIYGEDGYFPSGKTADTYAYDLTTAATYVDTGKGNDTTHFYTGANGLYPNGVTHSNGSEGEPYRGVAYEDYRESIYVGYKWYETADTEGFWDSSYAKDKWNIKEGYEDVVQYPFGYGLSYTEFEWKITSINFPSGSTITKDDTIQIYVRVTNSGMFAGQDVVELYFTPPYTKGGIEKASVNLGAFAKTQMVLNPGETEDIVLEIAVKDMASYDYQGKIIPGGGYVLEKGDYTLSLRTDAHTLAGKKIVGGESSVYASDTITYHVASDTRCYEEASNHFTGTDASDGVATDGNSDGTADITYLSRADFASTFPAEFGDNREIAASIKELNLFDASEASAWDAAWEEAHPDAEDVVFGNSAKTQLVYSGNELTELGKQLGSNYDDPAWDDLLEGIAKDDMLNLVLHGYTKTAAIRSIGKPQTRDLDGPNQIGSFVNDVKGTTGFSSIVLAQSWNTELAYSMGLTLGKECADRGISGWYGPGINVHRSPFGGRNYEYYSEDALLSGRMSAYAVAAAKNRGVFSYLKHICLYESESGRDGMYTWVTEQALREIYLKPFEISVREHEIKNTAGEVVRVVGGSNAIMTSYGRIGAVWTGGSNALLNETVRGEWGFQGAFLTDYADHHQFMNGDQMLRAGGDLWMDGVTNGSLRFSSNTKAFNYALKAATKNVLYMWMSSLVQMDNYNQNADADDIVIPVSPELNFRWYIPVVIAVDVVTVVGCGLWIFFTFKKKKNA